MNPIIVVLILLGIWLLLPRRKQALGGLKRTPKLTIAARMVIIPFAVVGFWGLMFDCRPGSGLCLVLGGVGAVLVGLGSAGASPTSAPFSTVHDITDSGRRMGEIPSLIHWSDRSTRTLTR